MFLWFARRLPFPRPGASAPKGRNGPLTPRSCPRCAPQNRRQRWGYEICMGKVGDSISPTFSCDF
jgi:hypothetical protein